MNDPFPPADDLFLERMSDEARRVRAGVPAANCTIVALNEEAAALVKAMLHLRDRERRERGVIHRRTVQVAPLATRCTTEGDTTIGANPSAENGARREAASSPTILDFRQARHA